MAKTQATNLNQQQSFQEKNDPIWLIMSAHLECESQTAQNVLTRIYKRAQLRLLLQALVGTFPSITTVLTDRAFRSMPNS